MTESTKANNTSREKKSIVRHISVNELSAFFTQGSLQGPLPVPNASYAKSRGILIAPPDSEFYLDPILLEIPHETSADAFCCLVDAPAGVGKTALAHNMMLRLAGNARLVIYVPLKGAIIGHSFFSGLLSDLFPDASKAALLEAVFSGHIALLFDGYDEVSMTSAQLELNRLFVREILDAAHSVQVTASIYPSIVFLFRSVFFEFGIFDEIVPLSRHYRVKYFDRELRRQYLIGRLGSIHSSDAIKGLSTGNIPLVVENFLQGFETQLSVAATEHEDAFFGHALVLSALADYIVATLGEATSANAHKIAQDFSDEQLELDTGRSVALLKGVEEKILLREEDRFPNEAFSQFIPDFVGYPSDLQRQLLDVLAQDVAIGGGQEASGLLDALSTLASQKLDSYTTYHALTPDNRKSLYDKYWEELRNRLDNHPFVDFTSAGKYRFRNPIYEELYLARYFATSPRTDIQALEFADRTPSYFLPLFLLDALGGDLSSHVGMLFHVINLLSTSCNGSEYRVSLQRDSKASRWVGQVNSANVVIPPFFLSDDILLIEVPSGALLQHFDISGEGHFVGILATETDRAPNITISDSEITADHLELDAHRVAFESVVIRVNSLHLTEHVQTLDGTDTLALWADAELQLTAPERFRAPILALIEEARQVPADNLDLFKSKLRKILSWFRKHGKDTYGVVEVRFWTVATNKRADEAALRVVECLRDQRILSFSDGMVLLDQDRLAQYGIHYLKQNDIAFGDGVNDLFAAYLG